MENKKKLKAGELVQIWDHKPDPTCGATLSCHGEVGYLIRLHPGSTATWKVICFGKEPPETYDVHEDWLNPIHSSRDIKKKT